MGQYRPGGPSEKTLKETSAQQVIGQDSDGRWWLYRDLLDHHHEYVTFTGTDGTKRLDAVATFDVFEWKGDLWEVQGWDALQRRWWVEPAGAEFETTDQARRAS